MRSHHPENLGRTSAETANRRNSRRLPQDNIESNFGPVLDLSAGGMRVISSKALSGVITVSLSGRGFDQKLRARVTRCKKVGFRVYEAAFQFLDDRQVRKIVEWLAFWSAPPRRE
jgi:hypothetical protein